jgi:hypothetical protein
MPDSAIAGERIQALAGEGMPGVVVLVAGPDGVQALGAAELADIAAWVPASPGMVCPWFSMTKIVTATAAGRTTHDPLDHGWGICATPSPRAIGGRATRVWSYARQ